MIEKRRAFVCCSFNWWKHREHTSLLSRMKVNKGNIEKNEFSTFVFRCHLPPSLRGTEPLSSCPTKHCSAKLVPRPFRDVQNIFLFIYNLIIYKPEKCLYNVKSPRYEFGVTFVCKTYWQRFISGSSRKRWQQETKINYSFFSFLLFTLILLNTTVCSLWRKLNLFCNWNYIYSVSLRCLRFHEIKMMLSVQQI